MVVSIALDDLIEIGKNQRLPEGPAKLGYFKEGGIECAAENVFVLVVHYDFKDGKDEWPRPGNEKDVKNLRKTFAENRHCTFRECSPKKENLLALLQDEQKLRSFFGASEVLELHVFFLIVLSHGNENGVICTEFLCSSNDYETFTANELFKSIKNIFPKSLKSVFLGPCRGQLQDSVFHPDQAKERQKNDLTKNQNSCTVSFEPKIHNLIILYSTVETTKSRRNPITGTWLVTALCEELNGMIENTNVAKIFIGIQNRIHQKMIDLYSSMSDFGQTPEFKMFPCDRKFIFQPPDSKKTEAGPSTSGTDAKGKVGTPEKEKPRSIDYDWWNPKTEKVLRGRRAVIFHQGEKNEYIRKLDAALITNLGFETSDAKIDNEAIDYYCSQSEKSWSDYGCFAAFFFTEIEEKEDGQVCILNIKKTVGQIIHGLLGPKNEDWIGKPKLFFLIDTKSTDTDGEPKANKFKVDDVIRATNHSGWLVFILHNLNLVQNFLEIFQSQEIIRTRSLQESLSDLIVERKIAIETPEAMMVSTLPHQLFFPILDRNFIQPQFRMQEKGFVSWKALNRKYILESEKIKEENGIWLLSSDPGSGKSTVMRELTFELQRNSKGEIKVFLIVLLDTYSLFAKSKKEKRKVPSLALFVSHATGTRELEIQNLIEQKKIMLMLDGFDEICPYYRDEVIEVFAAAAEAKVPVWISTRPHEEDAILANLGIANEKVCNVQIMPLDWEKQIKHLMMISKKSEEECKRQIAFYRGNGLFDILENPLHLKMIAELTLNDSEYKKGIDLYEIYERIIDKILRFTLKHLSGPQFEDELICCETELTFTVVRFFQGIQITDSLKHPNNGIVTISDGRTQFVHQTFAEFLAAKHFVDSEYEMMPFDILKKEFRHVRKFVDLKISSDFEVKPYLMERLEKCLKHSITSSSLKEVILKEHLVNFSTVAANIVSLHLHDGESIDLNYNTEDILVLASERDENFTLCLLENGAYEKLANPKTCAVEMLEHAIRNNFVHLFSKMNKKCANLIELARNNGTTEWAIQDAASKNHKEILRLVLQEGIIIQSDQDALNQALQRAVEKNSAECVKLLIEHGAQTADLDQNVLKYLNIKTTKALLKTKDEPMLKLASRIFNDSVVEGKNAEVAKFLFEKFSDEQNTDFEVRSDALIEVARWDGSHDTAEIMCRLLVEKRGFQIREKDKYGRNAFHLAAEFGNVGLVKYFHQKNPELIKILTDRGDNAMHLTLKSWFRDSEIKIEMCKVLHNLDSEMVKQKTATNETMLHVAANHKGNLDLCKWLVEEIGLEVDAVNDRGWNAMHIAASCSWVKLELLEYLHAKNSQLIDKKTKKNETPLHLVARNWDGKVEIYNWFVGKGVDESVKNSDGQIALQAADERFLENYNEYCKK